jgi:hypothetical protein
MMGIEPEKTIYDLVMARRELDSDALAGYVTAHSVGRARPAGAAAPRGRRARHRGAPRPPVRRGQGELRRDRRRHAAVLPRAGALDARPHRPARAGRLAGRARGQERQADHADARPAALPEGAAPPAAEPDRLQGRPQEERGRAGARSQGRVRAAGDKDVPSSVNRGVPLALASPRSGVASRWARSPTSSSPSGSPPTRRRSAEGGGNPCRCSLASRSRATTAPRRSRRRRGAADRTSVVSDPFAELKTRVHKDIIARLGPRLFNADGKGSPTSRRRSTRS